MEEDNNNKIELSIKAAVPAQDITFQSKHAPHYFIKAKLYFVEQSKRTFIRLTVVTNKNPQSSSIPHLSQYDSKTHFYTAATFDADYCLIVFRLLKGILEKQKAMGKKGVSAEADCPPFGSIECSANQEMVTITPQNVVPKMVDKISFNYPVINKLIQGLWPRVEAYLKEIPSLLETNEKGAVTHLV